MSAISKSLLKDYGKNLIAVVLAFAILTVLMMTGIVNSYYKGIIIFAFINIIIASSLNLVTGYMGQMALGHAGFMALGAYAAAIFALAVDFPPIVELVVGVILGGIVAGIFGILIGIPALRLRGDYLGIVTLGFGEIIRTALLNLEITGGAAGLKKIPGYIDFNQMYILLVLVITFLFLFIRSRHGRAILSIKEDEIAAESIGIPTTFYKVYGFAISAFIAGVGGGAFAYYQRTLDPKKFTFMLSVEFFIIVVLGGMGSLTGTIIAALVLAFFSEMLHAIENLRLVIYAVILIIMMIFRPKGILGTAEFSLKRFPSDFKAFIEFIKTLSKPSKPANSKGSK